MIALLVMTDGRDGHLAETLPRAAAVVPHTALVIHDDTGDLEHRQHLQETYAHLGTDVIGGPERRGFGGAIRAAWQYVATLPERFVFHLEDDFVISDVDVAAMAQVLELRPNLVQLALRRQPWNEAEKAAGGIVEQYPDDYTETGWGEHRWLEHRRFFTTNPSLYRRTLCAGGWPDGEHSEGRFGLALTVDNPDVRFGFWGARDSGELCHHIGHTRVGSGY